MTWFHTTGACNGTADMLDKLFDWVASPPWTPATGGIVARAGKKAVTPASGGDIHLPSYGTYPFNQYPRWASSSANFGYQRQVMWGFSTGDVDLWLINDKAFNGSASADCDHPNMGIFAFMTTSPDSEVDDVHTLHSTEKQTYANPAGNSPPALSSCYPAYGAVIYHFFSNGMEMRVCFKRSTPLGDAWQHFSFGKISKASTAWDGGEYFSGNCAPHSGRSTLWSYSSNASGFSVSNHLVLSATGLERVSDGFYNNGDPCGRGFIRVVGAQECFNTAPRPTNWCAIGEQLQTPTEENGVDAGSPACGAVSILGGHSAGFGITSYGSYLPSLVTQDLCPNTWDNRAPGVGVDLLVYEWDPAKRWHTLGVAEGIRFVNIAYLAEAEVVNTDWMVFPLSSIETPNIVAGEFARVNTGNLGIAYKFQ